MRSGAPKIKSEDETTFTTRCTQVYQVQYIGDHESEV